MNPDKELKMITRINTSIITFSFCGLRVILSLLRHRRSAQVA